jgi:hypothetical protein
MTRKMLKILSLKPVPRSDVSAITRDPSFLPPFFLGADHVPFSTVTRHPARPADDSRTSGSKQNPLPKRVRLSDEASVPPEDNHTPIPQPAARSKSKSTMQPRPSTSRDLQIPDKQATRSADWRDGGRVNGAEGNDKRQRKDRRGRDGLSDASSEEMNHSHDEDRSYMHANSDESLDEELPPARSVCFRLYITKVVLWAFLSHPSILVRTPCRRLDKR